MPGYLQPLTRECAPHARAATRHTTKGTTKMRTRIVFALAGAIIATAPVFAEEYPHAHIQCGHPLYGRYDCWEADDAIKFDIDELTPHERNAVASIRAAVDMREGNKLAREIEERNKAAKEAHDREEARLSQCKVRFLRIGCPS